MKRFSWTITAALIVGLFSPVNAAQATAPAISIWVNQTGVVNAYGNTNRITAIAMNADGSRMAIADNVRGDFWLSANGGVTWVKQNDFTYGTNRARAVQVSADASKIAVAANNGIWMSGNFGTTWELSVAGNHSDVSMSADGTQLIAIRSGKVFISTNSGSTWSAQLPSESFNLSRVSKNGNLMVAASSANTYISTDSGTTWTVMTTGINWSEIVMSADGSKMYATKEDSTTNNFFTSYNNGLTWTQATDFRGRAMWGPGHISSSADGLTLYAGPGYTSGGPNGVFSSRDGGATWTRGVTDEVGEGRVIGVSANGKVALWAHDGSMLTYNDDFIVSSDASFTMKINGTTVTDGQTFELTPNSREVSVSVVATDAATTFDGLTCTQPGTCEKSQYFLENYYWNRSGTDQVRITAVAANRVDQVTKTITVTQPFIRRTILNYNSGDVTNNNQEITSGSGLPALASKSGYHFNHWHDGSTVNPRSDAYGKDINTYPIFGINATAGGFAINYNRIRGGYVDTEGNDWNCQGVCREVPSGSDGPEVTVYPDGGYSFIRWSDGSTANPRKDLNIKANIDVFPIFAPILNITTNNVTGEQVADVPSGTPSATIPSSVDIPLTTLKFDNAPSGAATVTVKPIANPAAAAATPFKASASTKIVDINVTGITGPVTVCLDGGPTDSIFHFTGGKWVELPSRTYSGGQVCGVTSSFSPFAAAETASVNSAPSAPASAVATATGKRTATVAFTAPASDGGSVVTSYTATSTPGGVSKTLTQAGGGTFNFDGLQPGTSYTFAVTAKNANGTSAAATSNSVKTNAADVASLTSISFTDDGSGTAGKLAWVGKNIDAVLYTGPAASYPGPFSFGAFTSSWNGSIRNLTPETSYTISIYAISADGIGESKSLTFKTGAKNEVVKNLAYWNTWLTDNTYSKGESARLFGLLNKFNSLETSPIRSFIKVPISLASTVTATSLTPKSCSVVSTTAKVDAGMVKAITKDTCTISYTVSGPSKAPATLVKDFVFKKVS